MKKKSSIIILLFVAYSCFDIFSKTYWSSDEYVIQDDPSQSSCKTLYRNLQNGESIGRIDCVSKIGANDSIIIVETSQKEYWILYKFKDGDFKEMKEISEGPMNYSQFKLKVQDLKSELQFEKEIK